MGEKAFSPESSGKTAVKPTAERNARWAAAAMTALALIGEARHAEAEEKPSISLKEARDKVNEDNLQKALRSELGSELGGKIIFEKTETDSRKNETDARWYDGHRHVVFETVTPGRPLSYAIGDSKTLEVQLTQRQILGDLVSDASSVTVERVMASDAEVFEEPTVTTVQQRGESREDAIKNCLAEIANKYGTGHHLESTRIDFADQKNVATYYTEEQNSVILSHVRILEAKPVKGGFYAVTLEAQRAATSREGVKEMEKTSQASRYQEAILPAADYLKEHGMEPDKGSK